MSNADAGRKLGQRQRRESQQQGDRKDQVEDVAGRHEAVLAGDVRKMEMARTRTAKPKPKQRKIAPDMHAAQSTAASRDMPKASGIGWPDSPATSIMMNTTRKITPQTAPNPAQRPARGVIHGPQSLQRSAPAAKAPTRQLPRPPAAERSATASGGG